MFLSKMSGEAKLFAGVIALTVLIIGGAVFMFSSKENAQPLTREQLIPQETATKGSASASAYLVEFSDFQCPACKSFEPLVKDVITTYGDRVTFAYRHYPLPQHPFAEKSSYAAEAAGRQGKFWEMHDKLFEKQETLSDKTIEDAAIELGLDMNKFKADMEDKAIHDKVAQDKAAGTSFGVNSTPSFFLNGKKLLLRTPIDLVSKLEEALK